MNISELELKRNFILRVDHDAELIRYITRFSRENKIKIGAFEAIGALKEAKLGFYNQSTHEYQEIPVNNPCEISSCIGNISLKDGKPFTHAHAVLSGESGEVKAGHLIEGRVFAAEIYMNELKGDKLERQHDTVTDLTLWEIK